MNLRHKNILVTGGGGFLGSWVVKKLRKLGAKNIFIPRSKKYDLREKSVCQKVVDNQNVVIHIAANVGGIGLNRDFPGQLFYDNSLMGIHLIESCREQSVEKMVVIGTACSYPKYCQVPFKEADFWSGYPDEVTGVYGLAKKLLLVQAQAYRKEYGLNVIYLILVNLYGPGDNFDPKYGHVIPSLINRMWEAKRKRQKKFYVWGSGTATREFIYVEDAADGIISALRKYNSPKPVNIGSGKEISIYDLVYLLKKLIGYKGSIEWDPTKPDGQPRRALDVSRAKSQFNFVARIPFEKGLEKTVKWFIKNKNT